MHWLGLSLKIKSADRLAYKLGRKFVYNFRFRRLIHFNLSSNSAVLMVNTLNMSTNIRTAGLTEIPSQCTPTPNAHLNFLGTTNLDN